jgi:hypothetical protein
MQQALKVLVIGMGVLIVIGLALVTYGLFTKTGRSVRTDAFGDVILDLPDGCGIADAQSQDGKLIVRTDGPLERGCQKLFVIDLADGKILGHVAPPAAP